MGGTTLLTDTYRPTEKARTQGMHDFLVFGVTIISSFSSGLLLESNGWQMLNYMAIPRSVPGHCRAGVLVDDAAYKNDCNCMELASLPSSRSLQQLNPAAASSAC